MDSEFPSADYDRWKTTPPDEKESGYDRDEDAEDGDIEDGEDA